MESCFVPAGHYIFRVGDIDDSIYVVQSGQINVSIMDPVCMRLIILTFLRYQINSIRLCELVADIGSATVECISDINTLETSYFKYNYFLLF